MAYDARIILAGQAPDVVGSLARGTQAAGMANDVMRQNRLAQVYQQDGPGIMAGEAPALNRLAQIDPMAGLGVQQTRLGMDATRQGMQHNEERLRLAYQQAGMKAQQFAMQMDEAQRAQAWQTFERGAHMLAMADTPEQFAQIAQMPGVAETVDQFVGPGMLSFENRGVIVAAARGAAEALKVTGQQGPDPTSGMREYEMARSQGFQGSFMDYQAAVAESRRPQTNVNVSTGSEVGSIPQGWELFTDPETGGRSLRPIAGGPAAQEAVQAEDQAIGRQAQRARAGSTVIQDLQRALDLLPDLGMLTGGEGVVGGVARSTSAQVPGSVVNRITQFTESALSNVGLDTLQQMRENSPTGGALGQVPIQQQRRLEQVLGSLDVTQPPPVLDANIKRVINIYTDIIYGSAEERARAVQQGRMTAEQSAEIDGFYYDLPFDERGRPVAPTQPAPAGGAQSTGDAPAFIPEDDRARWQYFDDETRQLMIQHYGGQR